MADSNPFTRGRQNGSAPINPYDIYRNIPTTPEHLFPEEVAAHRRGWADNLQYYTGTMYLTGAAIGGAKGTIQGLKAAELNEGLKLRVNRVLNSGGGAGRRLGNSMGVVGLLFGALESGISAYSHYDDTTNTILVGLGTGSIYRIAQGPRSIAIAGAIGGLVAGVVVAGKQFIFLAVRRYAPNIPI
ncbi:hypothetical protein ACHQM5_022334 [Ranunculus cassubicifolius]